MLNKDLSYYMSLEYTNVIEETPDGHFVGRVEELNGCITQADTKDEAVKMLEDAKMCWLEIALEDGETIPEPKAK